MRQAEGTIPGKVNTMKREYIRVDGVQDGVDFDAHYTVKGYRGVAWYLLGWAAEHKPVMCYCQDDEGNEYEEESGEFELEREGDNVVAVMVGDDRRFVFDRSELTIIPEDGFCRDCGQVGCHCNVYA